MKIEQIAVSSLKSYERNARTHSDAQVGNLVKSIQEFGFVNPILIDENNILIAGHGRTAAAKKIGLKTVPAIRLSGLTEPQKKALRLADNKLALDAGWDEELLKMELQELNFEGFDVGIAGFTVPEISFAQVIPEEEKEAAQEADLRGKLPQELQNTPLQPTEQPKLSGNDVVEYSRIIIVYKPSEVEELRQLLRLQAITQVVYNLDDIKNAQY